MNWIKRTIWEIDRSSSLAWLGTFISLSFIIIYFFWSSQSQLFDGQFVKPLLCWDFFPQCSTKIPLPANWLKILFNAFFGFSLISMLLFAMRSSLSFAWLCNLFAWLIFASIYSMDASLSSNVLGFFALFVFGYLFVPSKQKLTRYLIVAFYLVDCYTKLNAEWLSGMPLYGVLQVPEKGLEWIASFSVLIQLVMPFFLISRDGQRLSYGFGVLFLYHLFHFYLQKDPSHLVMALLLIFFIFDYFEFKKIQRETMYQSYEHPEPSSIWWPALLTVFVFSQLQYAGGRFPLLLFQMQQPTGSMECLLTGYANFDKKTESLAGQSKNVPAEFKCNPMVNFNRIKSYCEEMKKNNSFENITAFFLTRKLSDESYQVRFSSDRFCDSSYTFNSRGGL